MASHVCSSRYGRLLCIRTCSALVPAYRSLGSLIPSGQPNAGVVDQSGRNIIASRDSREVIPATCLSPLRLHLPHFFRTLLHPAANLHLALAPALAPSAPCPLQPNAAFRIAAPCPSRRHYPRSWHASTKYGVQHGTALQQSTPSTSGHGTEPGRGRPSPLRVNHDLPCPALHRSSAMTIPLSDPDQARHHGQPASHPSIHPSTVDCDDHPPLRGAGHPDAGTQPTNCHPAWCIAPSLPSNASSSHWPRRAAPFSIKNARVL